MGKRGENGKRIDRLKRSSSLLYDGGSGGESLVAGFTMQVMASRMLSTAVRRRRIPH